MKRTSLFKTDSLIRKWIALVLIVFGMGRPVMQFPQEKQKESKTGGNQSKPAEEAPANKNNDEEYFEIQTPFGKQRISKKSGAIPLKESAQPAPTATGAQTPEAAPPTPPSLQQAPPPQPETKKQAPVVEATPAESKVPAAKERSSAPVRLQLDRADLQQVINIICTELKLNYIVDPKLTGQVTINTKGELHRDDLLPLLETILSLNGAALVRTGNLYKILPSAKAKQVPVPIQTGSSTAEAAQQGLVMQIVPMKFVAATDMSKILTPFLSDSGNMLVHERGNILIITETEANLKRLMDLVDIFDADVFENKKVRLFPIKNNRSKDLVSDLEAVFSTYALSSKESAVRFLSVDRINSVLAVTSNPGSFAAIESWIQKLDRPPENLGVKNFVYKVENSEARQIAALLVQIYGQKTEAEKTVPVSMTQGAPAGMSQSALPQEPTSPLGDKTLAGYIQGEIKIIADEINNVLIIHCSTHDYETVKETIKALDIVPRQVLIDAKIYEVNLTGSLSMGVSAFLQQRSNASLQTAASYSSRAVGILPAGLNVTAGMLIGNTRELIGFLNAQESRTRTRVLSAPSVIASDNMAAKIQVGSEVPMLTSQGLVPGATQGGTSLFTNTISNRQTGIIMNVTPRVNASGWVTLKINQEVSSPVAPDAGSAIQSPSISVRSVNTQITVKDGETIAIAGIISENKLLSRNRVPLLGEIPGLGLLFGNTTQTNTRTELIALITPHVVQDLESSSEVSDELKSKLKKLKKDIKNWDSRE